MDGVGRRSTLGLRLLYMYGGIQRIMISPFFGIPRVEGYSDMISSHFHIHIMSLFKSGHYMGLFPLYVLFHFLSMQLKMLKIKIIK